jgi:hypothetical protein
MMTRFALDEIPRSLWPIRVLQDQWGGKLSGGKWIAYHDDQAGRDDTVWNESQTRKGNAATFWTKVKHAPIHDFWWIAVGDTPNKAVEALVLKALNT